MSEQSPSEYNSLAAAHAHYQANVAAENAAGLANWVQHLWGQVAHLQSKVTELEDWKKKALEDVRKLRDEHKTLKRRVMGIHGEGLAFEEVPTPSPVGALMTKAKTAPMLGKEVAGPPPGLGGELSVSGSDTTYRGADSRADSDFGSLSEFSATLELDGGVQEGIQVKAATVEGAPCERAEWKIRHLSMKLRGCMGRALVSPPFSASGLEDLRLMVSPDGKEWTTKGPRSKRQRDLYTKKIMEGPLQGCLKLKVPSPKEGCELKYYLKVGSVRCGPFTHNFAENTVQGCDDFGVDWLKQVEADSSLSVCVEILGKGAPEVPTGGDADLE
jgi:hypothetical protein